MHMCTQEFTHLSFEASITFYFLLVSLILEQSFTPVVPNLPNSLTL